MPSPLLASAPRSLRRAGLAAALAEPLFLMHGRSLAEAMIVVAGACFLARCAMAGRWAWLRKGWVPFGLAWWAWLCVCSIPGVGGGGWASFAQALAAGRLLLFVAALELDLLSDPAARRWMARVAAACAAYIGGQALLQFAVGYNLYGYPRSGDGELTGPFPGPRAGPPLSRILLPATVPAACAWLAARRPSRTAAAYALLLGGVAVMVLIGQRMPLVLTAFGLLVVTLLLPRLRPLGLAAILGGSALVAASAALSPPTYYRLVDKFEAQMATFPSSPYGVIYTRAAAIAAANPVTGLGMNGFRTGCPQAVYDAPTLDGRLADGGGDGICTTHPHNFYMQAASDAGLPGLVLFAALALAWTAPLWRAARTGAPMCVALFAAVLIQLWPIASTSGFFTLPMAGWLFLTLGWGLAEARVPASRP